MERNSEYDAFDIHVNDIFIDNDFNCREAFAPHTVEGLAASIKQSGRLLFPVTVRPGNEMKGCDLPWHLLAGHRRLMAVTKFLGWTVIPAVVARGLSEHQARLYNLKENLERKNLDLYEEASALRKLFKDEGKPSLRKIATVVQRPISWVKPRWALFTLEPAIIQYVKEGLIKGTHLAKLSRMTRQQRHKEFARIKQLHAERGGTLKVITDARVRTKGEIEAEMLRLDDAFGGSALLALWALRWAAGMATDFQYQEAISTFREKMT
jgi:ParB/RepB/Spo0J family partition protein